MRDKQLVNQRILQQIVNTLFEEHGKLIGEDGFLEEGLDQELITQLRINALIKAPAPVAERYRSRIQEIFLADYQSRMFVFKQLIYPSANSATNYFGADFLHEILINQPSAFEREGIWLGGDRYGINEQDVPFYERFEQHDLQRIIDPVGEGDIYLPETALHNEYPLVYGWTLATLDQSLRERLRVALTKWGLRQPYEFLALLEKLFFSNDPQIQEDLASITLGLASKLKDRGAVQAIANWSIQNIFSNLSQHRNVIVRQGFRSIVERAIQYGTINSDFAKSVRPRKMEQFELLPLEPSVFETTSTEIYPIVHDLAWYVIKQSFTDFLEFQIGKNIGGNESPDLNAFAAAYCNTLGVNQISTQSWAIAAAIAYMKRLGFSRKEGNGFTQATHGSKSKIFTLEEKYSWLAVHYIQGYLADYLPLKDGEGFVKDFTRITDIPNPADFMVTSNDSRNEDWLIQEELTPELPNIEDVDEAIRVAVESEPEVDLTKWLRFKKIDFLVGKVEEPLLAIFNYTSLHDINEYIKSSIDARAVLIEKGQQRVLLELFRNHPKRAYFIEHIDRLVASPDTDTYSNPTDIVWMDWIGEQVTEEFYYTLEKEEKKLFFTVTSVTSNSVNGENETFLPSKRVRSLLGITELSGQLLLNGAEEVKGYLQLVKGDNYDLQEMVLVPEKEFLLALEKVGLQVVWLVDLLTSKNPLNQSIKSSSHPMKARKYFVFLEGGEVITTKIWDARFSNVRDKL